jgi:cytochrome c biogenesis protein
VGSANLSVGETTTLPDGTTIAFTGYREFAALQYSHDPGQMWVLAASVALLTGLLGMLLLRRERVFARVTAAAGGGGTVLTLASLTRGSGENAPRFAMLTDDLDIALGTALAAGASAPEPEDPPRVS